MGPLVVSTGGDDGRYDSAKVPRVPIERVQTVKTNPRTECIILRKGAVGPVESMRKDLEVQDERRLSIERSAAESTGGLQTNCIVFDQARHAEAVAESTPGLLEDCKLS